LNGAPYSSIMYNKFIMVNVFISKKTERTFLFIVFTVQENAVLHLSDQ